MSPPLAFAVDSIHGFEMTGDGQYPMLKGKRFERSAVHCPVVHELIAERSKAIGSSERIRHKKARVKLAMPCGEAWAAGKNAIGARYPIFAFRLRGGAEVSFQLHRSQAANTSVNAKILLSRRTNALAFVDLDVTAVSANAADSLAVRDIRIEGLRRIEASTVRTFLDGANVWGSERNGIDANGLLYSYGLGVAQTWPIAPLELSLGFPAVEHTGDQCQKFPFQIGTSF